MQRSSIQGQKRVREQMGGTIMSVHCDTCGVRVSSQNWYLADGIVCSDCCEAKRNHDTDTLQKRIDKYGGGDKVDAQTTLEDLCYGDES
jgi:hypothetical protein